VTSLRCRGSSGQNARGAGQPTAIRPGPHPGSSDPTAEVFRQFANGIRRDQQAVTAGLTLPYSAAVERHRPDPLVRGEVLRLPSLRKGRALILLLGVWSGGEMLVLSLYCQQMLHDSPLMTGLAIAQQGIVGFAAGVLGARLAARMGTRWLLVHD
jgi:hypothetical protein